MTITAVISFKSDDSNQGMRRAKATTTRYTIEPIIAASVAKNTVLAPRIASPIMTEARPMTIMPIPDVMSAKPDCWAISAPDNATRPFDKLRPRIIVLSVCAPKLRIICLLSPVARRASPRSVLKNKSSSSLIAMTTNGINHSGEIELKSVASPSSDTFGLPKIRILIEYSAIIISIPDSSPLMRPFV
ncbi:hypothetical protein D3C77_409860 [compost metagenome]